MLAYQYDQNGIYRGTIERQKNPLSPDDYLLPAHSTPIEPPECSSPYRPRWNGTAWELVEDHRRYRKSQGQPTGGTPYRNPAEGDDWRSEPRYMKELGPLPDGAVTEKPEKPGSEIEREEMMADIAEAKAYLQRTDYAVIKCAEQGLDLDEVYPGLKEERQSRRDLINQIEAQALAKNLSLTTTR